jgi:hypothetical protein
MSDQIEQLRGEIEALKKDVAHLLQIMDQDLDEDGHRPKYPTLEVDRIAARLESTRHIPFIVHATDQGADLVFHDKDMRCRILLSIDDDGPRLEFRNAEGKLTAQIAEASDGSGQFCVCDPAGNPRAGMRFTDYGGLVNVLTEGGKPQSMIIGTEQGGEIHAVNNQQRTGVKLLASDLGGIITVHETSGQIMGYFSGDNSCGSLTIHGPLGSPAVSLAASVQGGAVLFYDGEGVSTSMLP